MQNHSGAGQNHAATILELHLNLPRLSELTELSKRRLAAFNSERQESFPKTAKSKVLTAAFEVSSERFRVDVIGFANGGHTSPISL